MIVNDNFVIRNIFDNIILFPIRRNSVSNDPIYINNVIYQILLNAPNVSNKAELCAVIIKLFNIVKKSDIDEVFGCVEELIKMELIMEVDSKDE